jgi:hypothetical protein
MRATSAATCSATGSRDGRTEPSSASAEAIIFASSARGAS